MARTRSAEAGHPRRTVDREYRPLVTIDYGSATGLTKTERVRSGTVFREAL